MTIRKFAAKFCACTPIFVAAVLLLINLPECRAADERKRSHPLKVLAWPQTFEIKSGSSWLLHVGLDNLSDNELQVLFSHIDTSTYKGGNPLLPLKVSVTSSSGRLIESIGPVFKMGLVQDINLTNLEPGQFSGFDINMANLYKLPTGRYDVAIFYDSSVMKGAMVPAKHLWRGRTDVVHISVNVK